MKTTNLEIEIKVEIEKSETLLAFLKKNATYISEEHQIDTYYTPAHRNFIEQKPAIEWLRLRESSGTYSINYKYFYVDKKGRTDYCDEYETRVEDISQIEHIFKALNMKKLVAVDKKRQVWRYKDYEIGIDSVSELGDFVEIEYKGQNINKKPSQITKKMVAFLKNLNCGTIVRDYVGYPFLLLFPREAVKEVM